jgi:hypothetical protein
VAGDRTPECLHAVDRGRSLRQELDDAIAPLRERIAVLEGQLKVSDCRPTFARA